MKVSSILVALATTAVAAPQVDDYCTFYSDSECSHQVGSVAYAVYNNGCFQNDGGYIKCGGSVQQSFALVQSPSNDDTCNCQIECAAFGPDHDLDPYTACTPIGLTPGYTDFRINQGRGCDPNNC